MTLRMLCKDGGEGEHQIVVAAVSGEGAAEPRKQLLDPLFVEARGDHHLLLLLPAARP